MILVVDDDASVTASLALVLRQGLHEPAQGFPGARLVHPEVQQVQRVGHDDLLQVAPLGVGLAREIG